MTERQLHHLLPGENLLHLAADKGESPEIAFRETAWEDSVAVLPFVNLSADPDQEYFCDGLTEELITKLSQIQELKVAALTSSFAFKGKNIDIREVGQRLQVENIRFNRDP